MGGNGKNNKKKPKESGRRQHRSQDRPAVAPERLNEPPSPPVIPAFGVILGDQKQSQTTTQHRPYSFSSTTAVRSVNEIARQLKIRLHFSVLVQIQCETGVFSCNWRQDLVLFLFAV